MTIVHVTKAIVGGGKITDQVQFKAKDVSFAEILSGREKTRNIIENSRFRSSDRLGCLRTKVVEQRPVCILCGMTISSEGTCMCEYPTVINNHSGVSLNYNASAQTECSDISDITDGNQNMQNFNDSVISRDANKIKLRHRCLKCGTVSDDGSCMCDALKDDDTKTVQFDFSINSNR